jgi:hypothetical protein
MESPEYWKNLYMTKYNKTFVCQPIVYGLLVWKNHIVHLFSYSGQLYPQSSCHNHIGFRTSKFCLPKNWDLPPIALQMRLYSILPNIEVVLHLKKNRCSSISQNIEVQLLLAYLVKICQVMILSLSP